MPSGEFLCIVKKNDNIYIRKHHYLLSAILHSLKRIIISKKSPNIQVTKLVPSRQSVKINSLGITKRVKTLLSLK